MMPSLDKANAFLTLIVTVGTVVAAVVGTLNRLQTSKFKRMLTDWINGPAFHKMIDDRADDRIEEAFASAKEIENKWRREIEMTTARTTTEVGAVRERVGQVDQRAEAAHKRIDAYLGEKKT